MMQTIFCSESCSAFDSSSRMTGTPWARTDPASSGVSMRIAIIGGSGFENPEILGNAGEIEVETPFGKPTSIFKTGEIAGIEVVLLSRHGRDHSIPPSQVNNRANLWAIKNLGCTHILATTACGSLREGIGRGDLVILDQFIDFTRHRDVTFHSEFENGELKHTPRADPIDHKLRQKLIEKASELKLNYHPKGTVITIEEMFSS